MKKVINNAQKKYQEQQNPRQNTTNGKVGETVIAKKPAKSKESNKDVGEYIDYEEVKD